MGGIFSNCPAYPGRGTIFDKPFPRCPPPPQYRGRMLPEAESTGVEASYHGYRGCVSSLEELYCELKSGSTHIEVCPYTTIDMGRGPFDKYNYRIQVDGDVKITCKKCGTCRFIRSYCPFPWIYSLCPFVTAPLGSKILIHGFEFGAYKCGPQPPPPVGRYRRKSAPLPVITNIISYYARPPLKDKYGRRGVVSIKAMSDERRGKGVCYRYPPHRYPPHSESGKGSKKGKGGKGSKKSSESIRGHAANEGDWCAGDFFDLNKPTLFPEEYVKAGSAVPGGYDGLDEMDEIEVEEAEFAALDTGCLYEEQFNAADTSGEGYVDCNEASAYMAANNIGEFGPPADFDCEAYMVMFDLNEDRKVTCDEVEAVFPADGNP